MKLDPIPEIIDGLPNLCGWDKEVEEVTRAGGPVYAGHTPFQVDRLQSAFAMALHMHQPLILQDGDLTSAPVVVAW